ncbi:S49 family peptidase [Candidatus Magnetaquicoccus inordinatus]|uniref:S49 family peptidase n=1 Tax=Candidatus Magnetaquicoccus inordinatus TaxID=2496818 RepID=UPI00102B3E0A|nr:S49 family peptidase [Candidatus Magnetaquicoccus inordinatus]
MRGAFLLAELYRNTWAILPESLSVMQSVLHRWAAGGKISEDDRMKIAADKAMRAERKSNAASSGGGMIAVLPLYGVLVPRGDPDDISGGGVTGLQQFAETFRAAAADPSVSAIMIDIDSPGGSTFGVQELCSEIQACKKPVVAFANPIAASAAYWIGTSASEFYCTPSGQVGSIGVYACHLDESEAMKMAGLTPTLISAGKFKVEGNKFSPLDEECRQYIQSQVDAIYWQFVSAVAKGRKMPVASVRDGMGQGRILLAKNAVTENMIDGVATFGEFIQNMQKKIKQSGQQAAMTTARTPKLDAASRMLSIIK